MDSHVKTAAQPGKALAWVADRESWFVLLAVPLLLLPEYLAPLLPLAWVLLGCLICCRLAVRRSMRLGSALDLAVVVLLIMLPISVWVSSDPTRSLPKLTTSLGGLFLFWSIATSVRSRHDVRSATIVLALAAAALAVLGLIGTEWPASKVLYLSRLYDALPALVSGIPRSIRGGFHPNEVGGSLAMLVPPVCAIVLLIGSRNGRELAATLGNVLPAWLRRRVPAALVGRGATLLAMVATVAALLFVLVLTQSRGAMVGLAAGLATMLVLRERRVLLVLLALAVCVGAWDLARGGRIEHIVSSVTQGSDGAASDRFSNLLATADELTKVGTSSSTTATGRVEIWRNALSALSDYPITGVGLYTFQAVSWANYVYTVVSPTFQMNHAHNTYLETGVDLGVPGLLAFLVVVVAVLVKGMRLASRGQATDVQWLASGLVGGLVANLTHGLVDSALPLGHKPGIIFWGMAGLIVAADRLWQAQPAAAACTAPLVLRRFIAPGVIAAALLVVGAVVWVPLVPIVRLNVGALALDQARLKPGLSAAQRTALLDRAASLLKQTMPWKADTVNLRLGIAANEQGQTEQARAYWTRTSSALPYLLAQGSQRMVLGQVKQAGAYFAHAAAVAPQSSSALYRAGALAAAQGNAGVALPLLQQAVDLDSFSGGKGEKAEAYAASGGILRSQQRWAEAVQAYQDAEALALRFTWQRELAQSLYHRDGNGAAAEAYLQQSIRTSPNQAEPYMGLIDIYDAEGRVDDAVALGLTTIKRFPDASAPLLYLGQVYMSRGQHDDAEAMFERVVALRPRSAAMRMWLVRLALQRQQPESAVAILTEGLRLMPGEGSFYVAMGDIQRSSGDLAGAKVSYLRALAIDPQDSAAQRGLDALPK